MLIQSANIKRGWPTFIVILLGAGLLLFAYSSRAVDRQAVSAPPVRADEDYSKFSHKSDSHSRLACASCHARADSNMTPRLPGHKACTDCHFAEFITPKVPLCNICHSSLSSDHPPLKAFPSKFNESFNAKFDHAQHNKGDAKPAMGCAACHTATLRRGVAVTIPSSITAHNTCYQCHAPGKTNAGGRDISSCATCHELASYRRTQTNAVAFNASFSHAEHSYRQRLNCADCHSLLAGLPQTRQVSSPRTAEHSSPARTLSCATCHNNKRAFGEADYDDCKRCHTGTTFKFKGVS
ncbi:MAG TPA: cytochrome c3 family protein [Pyrinomonadaceae bacterium]|jgi:c(7)-type cytochrome triheme protein